jgi:hypothetical protein
LLVSCHSAVVKVLALTKGLRQQKRRVKHPHPAGAEASSKTLVFSAVCLCAGVAPFRTV